MEKYGWKTLAIISLILLILIVAVTVILFKIGQQYELKRQTCAYDVCEMDKFEHDAFFYSDVDDYCYCFLEGEMVIAKDLS